MLPFGHPTYNPVVLLDIFFKVPSEHHLYFAEQWPHPYPSSSYVSLVPMEIAWHLLLWSLIQQSNLGDGLLCIMISEAYNNFAPSWSQYPITSGCGDVVWISYYWPDSYIHMFECFIKFAMSFTTVVTNGRIKTSLIMWIYLSPFEIILWDI